MHAVVRDSTSSQARRFQAMRALTLTRAGPEREHLNALVALHPGFRAFNYKDGAGEYWSTYSYTHRRSRDGIKGLIGILSLLAQERKPHWKTIKRMRLAFSRADLAPVTQLLPRFKKLRRVCTGKHDLIRPELVDWLQEQTCLCCGSWEGETVDDHFERLDRYSALWVSGVRLPKVTKLHFCCGPKPSPELSPSRTYVLGLLLRLLPSLTTIIGAEGIEWTRSSLLFDSRTTIPELRKVYIRGATAAEHRGVPNVFPGAVVLEPPASSLTAY